jgi:hypothetical protein
VLVQSLARRQQSITRSVAIVAARL